MLETSNLARKDNPYAVSENIPFSAQATLVLLTSAFFPEKLTLFVQKSAITQSNSVRAVRDFLVMFSGFVRQKVTVTENITSADSVCRIWPPDYL